MNKIIIEKMEECPLVHSKSEPNGHDCWGKYEYTHHDCVKIDHKNVRVFKDQFIIHDGNEVIDTVYDFELPDFLKIIMNENFQKEKRRKTYEELKKEFENDECGCPFCGEIMCGIELTHYKCKKCNEYFTN